MMSKTIYSKAIFQVQLSLIIWISGGAAASLVITPSQCSAQQLTGATSATLGPGSSFMNGFSDKDTIEYTVNSKGGRLSVKVYDFMNITRESFSRLGTNGYFTGCAQLSQGQLPMCKSFVGVEIKCENLASMGSCSFDYSFSASRSTIGPCGTPMFVDASGPCTRDANGCAMSPNYPSNYPDSESCEIWYYGAPSVIQVVDFDTEETYDKLVLNGDEYSGPSANGLQGQASGKFTWSSDRSTTGRGWKLCPVLVPTTTMTTTVTRTTSTSSRTEPRAIAAATASTLAPTVGRPMFGVSAGQCTVDVSGCAMSPNYPSDYGDSQSCSISYNGPPSFIQVVAFSTEKCCDKVKLGSANYSGSLPQGLAGAASGSFTWSSDSTATSSGWKLCPVLDSALAMSTAPQPPDTTATTRRPTPARGVDSSDTSALSQVSPGSPGFMTFAIVISSLCVFCTCGSLVKAYLKGLLCGTTSTRTQQVNQTRQQTTKQTAVVSMGPWVQDNAA